MVGVIGIRMVIAICNNLCILYSLKFISISKSILVLSINPLCCAIVAALVLKEALSFYYTILPTMLACCGIYLISLNKPSDNGEDDKNAIAGYVLIIMAAWLTGTLFVVLRYLNRVNMHPLIPSLFGGFAWSLQTIFTLIFYPSLYHFSEYDLVNVLLILGIGVF